MAYSHRFVFSLGGSLIHPKAGVDVPFVSAFIALIHKQVEMYPDRQFIIVTGGGEVCREYQSALRQIVPETPDISLSWMGVYTNRYHAEFLRLAFEDLACRQTISDYSVDYEMEKPILVAGAWKPGVSSDMDSVYIAEKYHADTVINLSNIDYVYDKDPRTFPDAKPYINLSWDELKQIVGDTFTPGQHTPFDAIATKKAAELGLKVIITNGKNLENLENILDDKEYVGTTIS